ncbi:hypothetical protein [Dyadobacter bucti]|uniref:hypothetical protein n=1 Tax=Dyadobacter bucti TaxID=2572203 RepID=UPI001107E55B|nr:hypothetical protein [Dyadobacter bucti]
MPTDKEMDDMYHEHLKGEFRDNSEFVNKEPEQPGTPDYQKEAQMKIDDHVKRSKMLTQEDMDEIARTQAHHEVKEDIHRSQRKAQDDELLKKQKAWREKRDKENAAAEEKKSRMAAFMAKFKKTDKDRDHER